MPDFTLDANWIEYSVPKTSCRTCRNASSGSTSSMCFWSSFEFGKITPLNAKPDCTNPDPRVTSKEAGTSGKGSKESCYGAPVSRLYSPHVRAKPGGC